MRTHAETVTMRDGVGLATDVSLPDADGRHPAIVVRTPYGRPSAAVSAQFYTSRGYAVVAQDCRGCGESAGTFCPWFNEEADGKDTHEWIGCQPWFNGRLGLIGASYAGLTQWLPAIDGSRVLRCLVPRVMTSNFHDSPHYSGGAFQLALNMLWGFRMALRGRPGTEVEDPNWQELFRTLPLYTADTHVGLRLRYWRDWVRHPRDDSYWRRISIEEHYDRIRAPALIMGGWYDLYSKQTLTNFRGMREQAGSVEARQHTRAVIGPWGHALSTSARTGEVDFGSCSLIDLQQMESDFLDRWLRNGPRAAEKAQAPLRLFIMGRNIWRDEHEWPLARTRWTPFYFHGNGKANSLHGDGALSPEPPRDEPPDRFEYDPNRPVPTTGGNNCCRPDILPWGPFDQRAVEQRLDVLVYTTAVLADDIEVTGPIAVTLYAASSAPDTDFTAKLVDVFPDGTAINLCDGIIRGRYRRSFHRALRLQPARVYEFSIDCWVTGNVFRRGHRIRVEISSSNFPRFDRNPNTGHPFGRDSVLATARQTVYHCRRYPSHVLLPVIPVPG